VFARFAPRTISIELNVDKSDSSIIIKALADCGIGMGMFKANKMTPFHLVTILKRLRLLPLAFLAPLLLAQLRSPLHIYPSSQVPVQAMRPLPHEPSVRTAIFDMEKDFWTIFSQSRSSLSFGGLNAVAGSNATGIWPHG
jgi:hypothetical protein